MEEDLDEDFMYYLEYAHKYSDKLRERVHLELAKAWLSKLTEVAGCVAEKRNRNIFLSRLVLAMQGGELQKPFLRPPPQGPLPHPCSVFGPPQPHIQEDDEEEQQQEEEVGDDGARTRCDLDTAYVSKDGRTYVATRSLGKGQGALTYMGVSVADVQDVRGPSCGDDVFSKHFTAPQRPPRTRAAFTVSNPPSHGGDTDRRCRCDVTSHVEEAAAAVMQLRGGGGGACAKDHHRQEAESWSDDSGDSVSVCEYYTEQVRSLEDYLEGRAALAPDMDLADVVQLRDLFRARLQQMQQESERLSRVTEAAERRLDRATPPEERFRKVWEEAAQEVCEEDLRLLERKYTADVKDRFLDMQKKLKLNLVAKGRQCVKKEWAEMCDSHQQQLKHLQDKMKTADDILEATTRDLEAVRRSSPPDLRIVLKKITKLVNDHKAEQEEVDRLERLVVDEGAKLSKLLADERLLNDSNSAITSEMTKALQ